MIPGNRWGNVNALQVPSCAEYLSAHGARGACEFSLVMPFGAPIPPSPASSRALLSAFAERGITFIPNRLVRALDPGRRVAILDDASEMPYDLFLGIPKHRVPDVVAESGMTEGGWIPVDPQSLSSRRSFSQAQKKRGLKSEVEPTHKTD